ncbi:MAG: agmatinase [Chloroflexi bacterium]|nr:agmatinase [Chloroflexota bacterium]
MFPDDSLAGHFYPPRNFGAIPAPYDDFEKARVVILPVLYDSTTDWKSGSRDGPNAIIDSSQYIELYDYELDREPYRVGIYTAPEVQPMVSSPEAMIQRVYEIVRHLNARGKMVAMLGGEHSLSLGPIRAHAETHPDLTVLQLDAHTDLRDEYLGTRSGHGSIMRRALELCPIVPAGIRSMSADERLFIQEKRLEVFHAGAAGLGPQAVKKIVSRLKDKVYITVDVDVFDLGLVNAVGTPEPGGLGWYEVISLLEAVAAQREVVGFDVVELCPREGTSASAFVIARLVYKLIGLCCK